MKQPVARTTLIALIAVALPSVARAASPEQWDVGLGSGGGGPDHKVFAIGAWPGSADGYDGQGRTWVDGLQGTMFMLYRKFDMVKWPAPTGFYSYDYESPIPPGGSKTWYDIYLWAQNYTPPAKTTECGVRAYTAPPAGYTAKIFLEYVPASCEWTGPMEIEFDPTIFFQHITLPIAEVIDPLQGVKMHLTVYAPVPEPCSLGALVFGLAGFGAGVRRRRGG